MEALAAVGLVGNIVQFVDFTCKLFDQASSTYQSHTGSSEATRGLELVAEKLQDLSANLSRKRHNHIQCQSSAYNQDLTSLKELAQDCQATATELLLALRVLKAKNPESKWSSFRSALATTWKQSRIDALEKRLSTYRSQLILQLQKMQEYAEDLSIYDSLAKHY